ncbi:MAG: sugar phosphate isomerase/epimerase [Novosphingobium sp.]|nr:sugar phosphate isomerase/epimerase [Novosphingobium sp.]
MHPRVCLHQVAFMDKGSEDFVAYCRAIGLHHMTLVTPMLFQPGDTEAAIEAMAGGSTHAAVVNHPIAMGSSLEAAGSEETEALIRAIDVANQVGAKAIYLVSGGRGSLSWDDAADKFAELLAPCLDHAKAKEVQLLVETASHLNVDLHLAHTLDDTIRLAEIAGIGVCIELQACWFEGNLKEKFRRAMPNTGLVQVSDFIGGDRFTPSRAVIGDGMVPLEALLGDILELGYTGVFDLELVGPRIVEEGPKIAGKRAAENLSEILDRLGA